MIEMVRASAKSPFDASCLARRPAAFFRLSLLLAALVLLAACAQRPGPDVLYPNPQAAASKRTVTVYVATSREQADPAIDGFTTERAGELSYAEFVISIPPAHTDGDIEWPHSAKPDPAKVFTVVSHTILSKQAFDSRINAHARTESDGKVALFVHGFNVSFQEGLFRLAQVSTDSDISGVPVFFSWPSQARLLDYATDKDSATFSRDGLTDVVDQLTGLSAVRSVMLFGHSMGGWLSMEALRQMALEGNHKGLKKLNVILASPDIDEDVFATQLDVIGPLDPPLLVLVSGDDHALQASRFIQGNRQRTGQLDIYDPEVVEKAKKENVLLLDISSIQSRDPLNHSRYADLASLYAELEDENEMDSQLRQAGALIFDAVGNTLSAPFDLAGAALDQ
ncbi:alpha/beta fold hydrolase [Martelella sp. HB161492]|uniref:alpha/beta hydrolase n=1 Tax=Martelella sp. HB161492 TaxID=2720726 RepID=UPI001FEFFF86|nr:alpha/beta fold hydrolase [Martelella sp. HB161492]